MGILVGSGGLVVLWFLAVATLNTATSGPVVHKVVAWTAIAWVLATVVVGLVLASKPKHREFGSGLLISVGITALATAGTCGLVMFPLVP